ncbi:hypothetical protein BV133_2681 [Blastochloris viridis]|uniref:Uncharacterized protein n=1 Tax=Blastochloris viridis TaxID=1079 RepID=A0A182D4C9_BLAVI|nr:hypothetical protein BV133_2681 [Blastochloris viridis]
MFGAGRDAIVFDREALRPGGRDRHGIFDGANTSALRRRCWRRWQRLEIIIL